MRTECFGKLPINREGRVVECVFFCACSEDEELLACCCQSSVMRMSNTSSTIHTPGHLILIVRYCSLSIKRTRREEEKNTTHSHLYANFAAVCCTFSVFLAPTVCRRRRRRQCDGCIFITRVFLCRWKVYRVWVSNRGLCAQSTIDIIPKVHRQTLLLRVFNFVFVFVLLVGWQPRARSQHITYLRCVSVHA